MVLKQLHPTINYKGIVWYYSGMSVSIELGVTYTYCNYPTARICYNYARIYARTNNIKFIYFKFRVHLLKKKSTEQKIKEQRVEIFNNINNFRKKNGIDKKIIY